MTSRKAMILITILSLLIVVVVVAIVHSGKDEETASIPITKDSVAIGSWSTAGDSEGKTDAQGEKTMNEVHLTLTDDGEAVGTFGKYDFEGSWEQVSKYEIRLVNSRGESVYKAVIDPEDEESGTASMDLSAKDVTDSMTWKLFRK